MKKTVLLCGYWPPPYFGPSITFQALMRSCFSRQVDVTFLKINLSGNFEDLEKVMTRKLLQFLRVVLVQVWLLTRRRFDLFCYPPSFHTKAFLKDAMFIWVARLFRCPVVLYAHGNNLPDFYRNSGWIMKWLIRNTVSGCRAGIVLGECLRFNFEPFLPKDRIFSVPSGIEPFDVSVQESPRKSGSITVLYLSNFVEEKGYWVLLKAIPLVLKFAPKVSFVFVGSWLNSKEEESVQAYLRQEGLLEHVDFPGRVVGDKKLEIFRSADIFVFPTFYYYETFGLVNLEAMQLGLPVIATGRGAIPEIVEDGVNGLIVREKDPEDLAQKILALVQNESLCRQMSKRNREKFWRLYTHERFGQRMIEVVEAVSE